MKKYRVTDKHKFIKENFEIHEDTHGKYILSQDWPFVFPDFEIGDWQMNGWIEEIQPKEFTRDDMLQFALDFYDTRIALPYTKNTNVLDYLNNWIK